MFIVSHNLWKWNKMQAMYLPFVAIMSAKAQGHKATNGCSITTNGSNFSPQLQFLPENHHLARCAIRFVMLNWAQALLWAILNLYPVCLASGSTVWILTVFNFSVSWGTHFFNTCSTTLALSAKVCIVNVPASWGVGHFKRPPMARARVLTSSSRSRSLPRPSKVKHLGGSDMGPRTVSNRSPTAAGLVHSKSYEISNVDSCRLDISKWNRLPHSIIVQMCWSKDWWDPWGTSWWGRRGLPASADWKNDVGTV